MYKLLLLIFIFGVISVGGSCTLFGKTADQCNNNHYIFNRSVVFNESKHLDINGDISIEIGGNVTFNSRTYLTLNCTYNTYGDTDCTKITVNESTYWVPFSNVVVNINATNYLNSISEYVLGAPLYIPIISSQSQQPYTLDVPMIYANITTPPGWNCSYKGPTLPLEVNSYCYRNKDLFPSINVNFTLTNCNAYSVANISNLAGQVLNDRFNGRYYYTLVKKSVYSYTLKSLYIRIYPDIIDGTNTDSLDLFKYINQTIIQQRLPECKDLQVLVESTINFMPNGTNWDIASPGNTTASTSSTTSSSSSSGLGSGSSSGTSDSPVVTYSALIIIVSLFISLA